MKFYTLDTEFIFGKYEGKTVKEVFELQPSNLDWCAINLDHFYIGSRPNQVGLVYLPYGRTTNIYSGPWA